MDYLSFIPVGIPASSRLVYRPVYPQVVVPSGEPIGGSISWKKPRKKKPTVIRYADFTRQEEYADALAKAAIPLTQISPAGVPEEDFEDDDIILFAIVRLLN